MNKCILYEPGRNFNDLLSSSRDDKILKRTSSMEMVYKWKPRKIFILASPFDCNNNIKNTIQDLVLYINNILECEVIVYDELLSSSDDICPLETSDIYGCHISSKYLSIDKDNLHDKLNLNNVDLVITMGGDGTLLIVNKIFLNDIPPVIGLSMGSLGYLSKFNIDKVKDTLQSIETKGFKMSLRSQLSVSIYNQDGKCIIERNALNECVIDRGLSPYITTLDVYYNGNYFTTVSGDGLLIGTPSGSTAYSMSAGGSIVHPDVQSTSSSHSAFHLRLQPLFPLHGASPSEVCPAVSSSNYLSLKSIATPRDRGGGEGSDGSSIMGMMEDCVKDVLDVTSSGKPAADLREAEGEINRRASTASGRVPSMLFTVICPHSISYRPLVLPCSALIEVLIPHDNRGNARVCIDGNYSCDIKHGSTVRITTSETLFPLVLPKDTLTTTEWCKTLKEHLHWNVRIRQNKLHSPPDTNHT